MREENSQACPVVGCNRCKRSVPMCRQHWMALAGTQRRLLLELEECDPVACGVAVLLLAEAIGDEAPPWAGRNETRRVDRRERVKRMQAAQRATCQRMRRHARGRDEYAPRTAAWREELERIVRLLREKYSALEVALAMVRGGHGTDGYCPFLVSAGLDLDDQRAEAPALAGT